MPKKAKRLKRLKRLCKTATSATGAALTMKLLVDAKTQRVLFAEARKDVVDFLFSLLTLPVGTVVNLLDKESMVGSVANLYASVEKLDFAYVQSGADKAALLSPTVLSPAANSDSSLLHLPVPSSAPSKSFFICSTSHSGYTCRTTYVTDASGTCCPHCGSQMTTAMVYVPPPEHGVVADAAREGANGFVQGIVTYTVMDDLTVTPMSAISSITLLSTFSVKDIGALQEKNVQLGYNEGLEILKASLQSKTVLTDVFLGKKPKFIGTLRS